jgi:hypothetical protein
VIEVISEGMSYITIQGRWCDIIVLNVHAQTEDTSNDTNDRFYEELQQVINSQSTTQECC